MARNPFKTRGIVAHTGRKPIKTGIFSINHGVEVAIPGVPQTTGYDTPKAVARSAMISASAGQVPT
jgi:hypothetical protein